MSRSIILAICLIAPTSGCSLSIATGDASTGGYTYSVQSRDGTATGHAAEFTVLQDGICVEMQARVLTVDGRSYGEIAPGATIEVDGSRVRVNQVELQAIGPK